jgi:hypothetical protein
MARNKMVVGSKFMLPSSHVGCLISSCFLQLMLVVGTKFLTWGWRVPSSCLNLEVMSLNPTENIGTYNCFGSLTREKNWKHHFFFENMEDHRWNFHFLLNLFNFYHAIFSIKYLMLLFMLILQNSNRYYLLTYLILNFFFVIYAGL